MAERSILRGPFIPGGLAVVAAVGFWALLRTGAATQTPGVPAPVAKGTTATSPPVVAPSRPTVIATAVPEHSSRQEKTERIPDSGIILEPPSNDYVPKVSREDALILAQSHARGVDDFSKSHPVAKLALYTNLDIRPSRRDGSEGEPLYQKVPIWMVSYDNACIPEMGPPTRERRPCGGGTEINVAIMAESGEYLQAFAYR